MLYLSEYEFEGEKVAKIVELTTFGVVVVLCVGSFGITVSLQNEGHVEVVVCHATPDDIATPMNAAMAVERDWMATVLNYFCSGGVVVVWKNDITLTAEIQTKAGQLITSCCASLYDIASAMPEQNDGPELDPPNA